MADKFLPLGQAFLSWYGMAGALNGNIYACVYNGDIYKQSGGVGNFVALGQPLPVWPWVGMGAAPNGNIYASTNGGDVYMQTGGVGDFMGLAQVSRAWYGMAGAPNGTVYAVEAPGDITSKLLGWETLFPLIKR